MYKIILQTGEVIREADGVVVAPCQSADEPNYVAYLEWVAQGNEPVVGVRSRAGGVEHQQQHAGSPAARQLQQQAVERLDH